MKVTDHLLQHFFLENPTTTTTTTTIVLRRRCHLMRILKENRTIEPKQDLPIKTQQVKGEGNQTF